MLAYFCTGRAANAIENFVYSALPNFALEYGCYKRKKNNFKTFVMQFPTRRANKINKPIMWKYKSKHKIHRGKSFF